MRRTGGSVRVVPVSGSEVMGSVLLLMGCMTVVNALLQQERVEAENNERDNGKVEPKRPSGRDDEPPLKRPRIQ